MSATQKLTFDDGLLRIEINDNGVLKFNPTDFNLYDRFLDFQKELPEIERKYAEEFEIQEGVETERAIEMTKEETDRAKAFDAEVKAKLAAVFGMDNDFDQLLGGQNIMSRGENGEYILTNLLDALIPYIRDGLEKRTSGEVAAAKRNREQRRAAQRGRKKA